MSKSQSGSTAKPSSTGSTAGAPSAASSTTVPTNVNTLRPREASTTSLTFGANGSARNASIPRRSDDQLLSTSFGTMNLQQTSSTSSSSSAAAASTNAVDERALSDALLHEEAEEEKKDSFEYSNDDLALLPSSASRTGLAISQPTRSSSTAELGLAHSYVGSPNSSSLMLDEDGPHSRHLTRRALNASIDRATRLKSSSSLARFSVNTVDKFLPNVAKNIAVNKWKAYGDPLVSYLDQNIDRAVNLIDSTGLLPQSIQTMTSPSSMTQAEHQALLAGQSSRILAVAPLSSGQSDSDTNSSSDEKSGGSGSGTDTPQNRRTDRQTALMMLDKDARLAYQMYWERLKEKFVQSKWYSRVDDILLQNQVVQAFSHRLGDWQRPAEIFYASVTEEFMSHGTYDDFLAALTAKLGPAWDDRLAPLAKGFFTTAKAVSALVGAGKFVGGALQLGRARVHSAIDDLLARWDRVLGLTDQYIDLYLPEQEMGSPPRLLAAVSASHEERRRRERAAQKTKLSRRLPSASSDDSDDSSDYSTGSSDDDGEGDDTIFDMQIDEQKSSGLRNRRMNGRQKDTATPGTPSSNDSTNSSLTSSKKRTNDHLYSDVSDSDANDSLHTPMSPDTDLTLSAPSLDRNRSVPQMVSKINKRIRQRIPSISQQINTVAALPGKAVDSSVAYADELKVRLTDNGWFTAVDELLMQNMFVRALSNFIRPAEHFFNTSLHLFQRRVQVPENKQQIQQSVQKKKQSKAQAAVEPTPNVSAKHENGVAAAALPPAASSSSTPASAPATNGTHKHTAQANGHHAATLSASAVTAPASTSSTDSDSNMDAVPLAVMEDFVLHLRDAMGASWDERLVQPARSFLHAAIEVHDSYSHALTHAQPTAVQAQGAVA